MANKVDKELEAAIAALRKEAHTLVDMTIDDLMTSFVDGTGRPKFSRMNTSAKMPFITLKFSMNFKKK